MKRTNKNKLKDLLLIILTVATIYSFYLHYGHSVDISNTFDKLREIYNIMLEMTGSGIRIDHPVLDKAIFL